MKRTSRALLAVLLAGVLAGCSLMQAQKADPAVENALKEVQAPVESFLNAQTLSYEYEMTVTSPEGVVSGLGTCLYQQDGPAWYERQSLFGEGVLATGISYETLYLAGQRWTRQQKLISSSMAQWSEEKGSTLPSGMDGLAALLAKAENFAAVEDVDGTYAFTLSDAYLKTLGGKTTGGSLSLTVADGAVTGLVQESTEERSEGAVTTRLTITELRLGDPNVAAQIEGERSDLPEE